MDDVSGDVHGGVFPVHQLPVHPHFALFAERHELLPAAIIAQPGPGRLPPGMMSFRAGCDEPASSLLSDCLIAVPVQRSFSDL
jgi:hypothetical protein